MPGAARVATLGPVVRVIVASVGYWLGLGQPRRCTGATSSRLRLVGLDVECSWRRWQRRYGGVSSVEELLNPRSCEADCRTMIGPGRLEWSLTPANG